MLSLDDSLRRALLQPESLTVLRTTEWDVLLGQAKWANLLARIQVLLAERGFLDEVPAAPRAHLEAARIIAENEQRIMRWEVNRIRRALSAVGIPVILLKGAAYALSNLPNAKGRISSDVDILVPREKIGGAEDALLAQGWEHIKLEEYDQYFYRTWSHELPPLRHRDRGNVVDVHYTILPPTGRLHPDPEKLIEASQALDGTGLKVLAPADIVLHCAAHAFHDGDLRQAMRDVVDLDDLLRHFGRQNGFWENLFERAEELDLRRPLYYALRYAHRILETPMPATILAKSERSRPPWPIGSIMDRLVDLAIVPGSTRTCGLKVGFARWLLYVRSHWLRMPPWLLARHLLRKSVMRWKKQKQGAEAEPNPA